MPSNEKLIEMKNLKKIFPYETKTSFKSGWQCNDGYS